jgi:UDP-N-acetylglucosamine pyrophosphorylase
MGLEKKIHTKENGRIDFGSSGAGNILSALMKEKVFDIWKKQGIKWVNIVGTDNLNTRVCDPLALAYLVESSFDCLADIVPNKTGHIEYPCILKTKDGTYDQFYPFEVAHVNAK